MSETKPIPTLRRAAAVVGLVGLAGLVWAGLRAAGGRDADRPRAMDGTPVAATAFVGSRACRDCHPGESAAHGRSGHARTLGRAGKTDAAAKVDGREFPDPETPGVAWRYRRDGERLLATRTEAGRLQEFILDYALGSGQHAVTFVSLKPRDGGPPAGLEHRLSYFTKGQGMGLTPGQAARGTKPGLTPVGYRLPPSVVLDCFECHGTRTAPPKDGGLDPSTMIPDVECERCHGPGQTHVQAARRGNATPEALALPFGPGRETAAAELQLCGRCHRLPSMVNPDTLRADNAALARFPSVGMAQSACYQKSDGALRCTTCHDAHARPSRDRPAYDATCRSCHTAPGETNPTADAHRVKAAPCPVEPRSGCVSCHMPRRDVGQGLEFSDHWVRKPAPAEGR